MRTFEIIAPSPFPLQREQSLQRVQRQLEPRVSASWPQCFSARIILCQEKRQPKTDSTTVVLHPKNYDPAD